MPVYAVRTTAGQERNVAKLIAMNARPSGATMDLMGTL